MSFIYQSIPDMIPIMLVQPGTIDRCIERNNSNYLDLDSAGFRTDWQRPGRHGCVKKEGYEEGIPLYKMLAWAWWEAAWHPMGKTWTVAPENWGFFKGNKGNTYLGKSGKREELTSLTLKATRWKTDASRCLSTRKKSIVVSYSPSGPNTSTIRSYSHGPICSPRWPNRYRRTRKERISSSLVHTLVH